MQPIMPEEDQATDIGNMHKNRCKDRVCGSGHILADRQTHRQTYSSQNFTTTPAGAVNDIKNIHINLNMAMI